MRDKVTRTASTNHNLFEEKGGPKVESNRGPSAYQPDALPLGQTGSQDAAGPALKFIFFIFFIYALIDEDEDDN